MAYLPSSFRFFLVLCSHFHFSSLPFPCVLLLQCSVSLLLGWPLRKPWARSAALLTLTLGLPVAQRASGKFSSLGALAWGAESMYVFMEFWQIPSSSLSLLRCRLDMRALYLIPHSPRRQGQCGGGAMGPGAGAMASVVAGAPLWRQQDRRGMGSDGACGRAMGYVVELYCLMAGYRLGHWHCEYWSLYNWLNFE